MAGRVKERTRPTRIKPLAAGRVTALGWKVTACLQSAASRSAGVGSPWLRIRRADGPHGRPCEPAVYRWDIPRLGEHRISNGRRDLSMLLSHKSSSSLDPSNSKH